MLTAIVYLKQTQRVMAHQIRFRAVVVSRGLKMD